MNFRTPVPVVKSGKLIDYGSKILFLGSCFSENMAQKCQYFQFQNSSNPFGILFHPLAIENIISRAVQTKRITEKDIFFHLEKWHSFEAHSNLSHPDKDFFISQCNNQIGYLREELKNASHIFITYGTAWVYKHKLRQEIVANCHKIPQTEFDKILLSTTVIANSIHKTLDFIKEINPNCRVVFTISPVRHLKDGFVENQRSKAHLITAVQEITSQENTSYFPSYEIMMDELRDYRFYNTDMIHPSDMAIDYIWQQFVATQMAENCKEIMKKVAVIQKGLSHRVFGKNTQSNVLFQEQLQVKIKALTSLYPFMQF
jgi:GSCFA family